MCTDLAITHAMPCRSRLSDKEMAPIVESEIQRAIDQRHLTLVGWYHSHPTAPATPTLRDIDSQLDYEIQMKGNSDASYTPCVGVICCKYSLFLYSSDNICDEMAVLYTSIIRWGVTVTYSPT